MANYSQLKSQIVNDIRTNTNEEITGDILQERLLDVIDSLGAGYQYLGVATSTNPGTSQSPDYNCFYIATTPGTYSYLGGLVVADGEVAILKYNGSWTKEVTGAATAAQLTQLGQKVDELAQGKFYGYFSDADELPAGDVPGFAYVGTAAPFAIYNFDGSDWSDSGLTIDEIPIGNGEDIDSDADGKLQFANRVYNAQQPNGMGYKILRKDATFAEQVTDANTIYEIRYPFDLGGASVTIPAGCVLKFVGGSLSNGTITGNSTQVFAGKVQIFNGIIISGTWSCPKITSAWFADATSTNGLKNVIALCDGGIDNDVTIENGQYALQALEDATTTTGAVLLIPSNTKLHILGTLSLAANNYTHYRIIEIQGSENVQIDGGGSIVGDADTHTFISGSTSEWGMGIYVSLGAKNISISDLSISKCIGDGIATSNYSIAENPHCENIIIKNVEIFECGRQGISLCDGDNIRIDNFNIHDIARTAPMAAIDFEPTTGKLNNVVVSNGVVADCNYVLCVALNQNSTMSDIYARNIKYDSCELFLRNANGPISCENCEGNSTNGILSTGPSKTIVRDSKLSAETYVVLSQDAETEVKIYDSNLTSLDYIWHRMNNLTIDGCILSAPKSSTMNTSYKWSLRNCEIKCTSNLVRIENGVVENCHFTKYTALRAYNSLVIGNIFDATTEFDSGTKSVVLNNRFGQRATCAATQMTFFGNFFTRMGVVNGAGRIIFSHNSFKVEENEYCLNIAATTEHISVLYNRFACTTTVFRGINNSSNNPVDIIGNDFDIDPSVNTGAKNRIAGNTPAQYGTTARRPTNVIPGQQYFDSDLKQPIFWSTSASAWITADGKLASLARVGATADRPTASTAGAGFTFFDTTLGKMIVSNGTTWVNMDGTALA